MSVNHSDPGIFGKIVAFGALGITGIDEVVNKPWGVPIISGVFAIIVALIYWDGNLRAAKIKRNAESESVDAAKEQQIDNLESANIVLKERCERLGIENTAKMSEIAKLTDLVSQSLAATPVSTDGK